MNTLSATRQLKRRPWAARSAALLFLGLWACSGAEDPTGSSDPSAETEEVSATISILLDDTATATAKQRTKSSPFGGAGQGMASDFTYQDITLLRVNVINTTTGNPIYVNFDLNLIDGAWTGTLPALPRNTHLTFEVHAFRGTSPNYEEIFSGQTQQTLTTNSQMITVTLGSVDNNELTQLAKIKKITVPNEIGSGKSANITFLVQANTGEHLSYTISSAAGGGEFFPTSGSIGLLSNVGTFVSLYAAPTVTSLTQFTHTISVTNESGNTVSTTFKTKVLPPISGDYVYDTEVGVLLNPVINQLNASRIVGTSDVLWQAVASDDGPASQFTYAWSFTPNGTFNPPPGFVDDQANPATLENYTTSVEGALSVAVTDGNGGTTSVRFQLNPNEFPDNPVVTGPITGLNSIRAGGAHTCVLLNNGVVRCFGEAGNGQLGYGNTNDIGDNETPITAGDVPLASGEVAVQIATGQNHTCALLDSGLIRCWGRNNYGQLGYNSTQDVGDGESIVSFGYVNLGGAAIKIEAGAEHTCALMYTGKVRCWGRNQSGQLGYGHTNSIGDNEAPYKAGDVNLGLSSGVTVKDIVAGANHTCALLTNGNVKCWGDSNLYELGYGNRNNIGDNELPSSVDTVNVGGPVLQLAAGTHHTCALLSTGRVRCWGYGGYGQLGYGGSGYVLIPANQGDVNLGGLASQVTAGSQHTCAILTNGQLKCWGFNNNGELGLGDTNPRYTPTLVNLDGNTAFQVTAGDYHTCALLTTGHAWCWGNGGSGRLGYVNQNNIGDNEQPVAGGNINVWTP